MPPPPPTSPGLIDSFFSAGETVATASVWPGTAFGTWAAAGPRRHPGGGATVPPHCRRCPAERGGQGCEGLGRYQAAAAHR